MEKKKAIKIATATAIAASAITAVAPAQSEAAASLTSQIKTAQAAMKKPYDRYVKAEKLAAVKTVASDIAKAQKAQKDINAAIKAAKLSSKQKSAYYAQIKAYAKYIDRAQGYVDAYQAATEARANLTDLYAALQTAIAAKDVAEVEKQYTALTAAIAAAKQDIKDTVYGAKVEALLFAKFTAPTEAQVKVLEAQYQELLKAQQEAQKYAETLKAATAKVDAYVAATADLSSADKIKAAKAAKAAIDFTGLKDADKAALQTKIDAADKKVADAEAALAVVTVKEVKATTSKTITVVFNKAVDTTKATFEVKKGSSTLSVATTTWNDAKTEAQLTLNSKLSNGTYNVTVKGLATTDLTGSVTAQDEKVAEIKILSDSLVLQADKKTATVGYQVLNQYGEDITTNSALAGSLAYSSSVGTADDDNKGKITVTSASELKTGDKVVVTAINNATATVANKTLTVAGEAKISEVTLGDVYNKDGKKLSEDTTADGFYILLTAKDQYGNNITDATKANNELTILTSNPSVNKITTESAAIEQITVNDKKQLAIKLEPQKAGDAIVTVITNATGTAANKTITVEAGKKVDTVVIGTPDGTITGNKQIQIPVEITNNKGEAVTKVADLKDVSLTVTNGTNSSFIEKDGKLYIQTTTPTVTTGVGNIVVTVNTPTNKVANQVFTVQPNAVATTLVGLKSTVPTSILEGQTATLKQTDFVVQDQYGNTLDKDYTVTATSATPANIEAGTNVTDITLKALKDSAPVTFAISKDGKVVSSVEVSFSTIKFADIKTYRVDSVGTLYATDDVKYAKDLKVYGVTAAGKEVLLPTNEYNVVSLNGLKYAAGKISGDASKVDNDTTTAKPDTVDATAKVIINRTGDELSVTGKVSSITPKAAKVEVRTDAKKDGTVLSTVNEAVSPFATVDAADLKGSLYVEDQYGVQNTNPDVALTFTNLVNADSATTPTISGNGTKDAKITNFNQNDTVTARITVDNVSTTVTVKGVNNSQTDINTVDTYNGDVTINATTDNATYGPATGTKVINGNVTISGIAAGTIKLQNLTINGDLTIDTPKATVDIQNTVTVTGKTVMKNVSPNTLIIRGTLNGGVEIQDTDGGSVQVIDGATIGSQGLVITQALTNGQPVVFKGNINVPVVVAVPDAQVRVEGTVGTLKVDAKGTKVDVGTSATVSNLVVTSAATTDNTKVTVTGDASKIGTVSSGTTGATVGSIIDTTNAQNAVVLTGKTVTVDTTAPTLSAASLTAGTVKNAVDGTIDLSAITSNVTSGSVTASEAATLKVTAVEGLDITKAPYTSQLVSANASTLNIINYLGSLDAGKDGVSLATLKALDKNADGFVTVDGTLTDDAGNKSNVTLKIKVLAQ